MFPLEVCGAPQKMWVRGWEAVMLTHINPVMGLGWASWKQYVIALLPLVTEVALQGEPSH